MSGRPEIKSLLAKRVLVLDGAMGTMLQQYGLTEKDFRGDSFSEHPINLMGNNDILSLTQAHIIKEIHEAYLEAGADIIETNTFNATSISQSDYGTKAYTYEINRASAAIASAAAAEFTSKEPSRPRYVAGAMGPTNRTASLSPDVNDPGLRSITFDDLYGAYFEQARGLLDGGVDILLVETIFDILNAKAALVAINDLFKKTGITLPLMLSFSITGTDGNILTAYPLKAILETLFDPGIFCIGLNCGKSIEQMMPFIEELSKYTLYYTCAYPSAGLPDTAKKYADTPEILASKMKKIVDSRFVNIIGGCCGTTPEHIRMLANLDTRAAVREITLKTS